MSSTTRTAATLEVRRLGIDAIGEVSRGLGFTASALLDRVRDARLPQDLVTGSTGTIAYAVLANWRQTADARDAVLADMRAIGEMIRERVCNEHNEH